MAGSADSPEDDTGGFERVGRGVILAARRKRSYTWMNEVCYV
jgi:hypothetical protein